MVALDTVYQNLKRPHEAHELCSSYEKMHQSSSMNTALSPLLKNTLASSLGPIFMGEDRLNDTKALWTRNPSA